MAGLSGLRHCSHLFDAFAACVAVRASPAPAAPAPPPEPGDSVFKREPAENCLELKRAYLGCLRGGKVRAPDPRPLAAFLGRMADFMAAGPYNEGAATHGCAAPMPRPFCFQTQHEGWLSRARPVHAGEPMPARAASLPAAPAAAVHPAAARLVAIGDLHGDFRKTVEAFQLAGLVDGRLRWSGGGAVAVQVGDQLDRGPDEVRIFYLLERLR
jgi:hypothetical protein